MMGKRIIFGGCRSAKSRKIADLVTQSLSTSRSVLLFCRDREGADLVARAKREVKGLSESEIYISLLHLGPPVFIQGKVNPMLFNARLIVLTMDIFDGPVKGELVSQVFKQIGGGSVEQNNLDIYLDDAQLWGVDALASLPDDITLVCQSMDQLVEMLGEKESDRLIKAFREWEFFRPAEMRTAQKAATLSNQKIKPSSVMRLRQGESILIERIVQFRPQIPREVISMKSIFKKISPFQRGCKKDCVNGHSGVHRDPTL